MQVKRLHSRLSDRAKSSSDTRFFQVERCLPDERSKWLLSNFLTSLITSADLRASDIRLLDEFLENTNLRRKGFSGIIKAGQVKVGSIGQSKKSRLSKFVQTYFCRCWKDRHLIINEEGLAYSHHDFDASVSDSFYFDSTLLVEHGPSISSDGLVLRIRTSSHKIKVKCRSMFDKFSWLQALGRAIFANKYCRINRFKSFAPPCASNSCRAYTYGEEYFRDVCEVLEGASKSIFITDWWLSPELHLLRPVPRFSDGSLDVTWRLDTILLRAAKRGCRICILLFKEVQGFMSNSSEHASDTLTALHPNIEVLRHPGDLFWFWSHHEKLCVIDQRTAFMGGIDLCFGRFDTQDYILAEPQGNPADVWFPGQDYSNVRVKDFVKVEEHWLTLVERNSVPRMPWRDIAVQLQGEIVSDIVRHFKQYWNFARYDLSIQQKNSSAKSATQEQEKTHEGADHTHVINIDKMEHKSNVPPTQPYSSHQPVTRATPPPAGGQFVRGNFDDVSRLFFGDFPDADLRCANDVSMHDTSAHSMNRTTNESMWGLVKNGKMGGKKQTNFPHPRLPNPVGVQRKGTNDDRPRVTEVPAANLSKYFQAMVKPKPSSDTKNKSIQVNNKQRRDAGLNKQTEGRGYLGPHQDQELMTVTSQLIGDFISRSTTGDFSCTCQLLRSSSYWSTGLTAGSAEMSIQNAYIQLISESKHFLYIENQFFISSLAGQPVCNQVVSALADRILKAARLKQPFKVVVVLPLLPGFEGHILGENASVLRIQLGWELATISQGPNSLLAK